MNMSVGFDTSPIDLLDNLQSPHFAQPRPSAFLSSDMRKPPLAVGKNDYFHMARLDGRIFPARHKTMRPKHRRVCAYTVIAIIGIGPYDGWIVLRLPPPFHAN